MKSIDYAAVPSTTPTTTAVVSTSQTGGSVGELRITKKSKQRTEPPPLPPHHHHPLPVKRGQEDRSKDYTLAEKLGSGSFG